MENKLMAEHIAEYFCEFGEKVFILKDSKRINLK